MFIHLKVCKSNFFYLIQKKYYKIYNRIYNYVQKKLSIMTAFFMIKVI